DVQADEEQTPDAPHGDSHWLHLPFTMVEAMLNDWPSSGSSPWLGSCGSILASTSPTRVPAIAAAVMLDSWFDIDRIRT
ncbi:MAG: hypothetical protein WBO54_10325, partial [Thermoanaerobaculia bacterium]